MIKKERLRKFTTTEDDLKYITVTDPNIEADTEENKELDDEDTE